MAAKCARFESSWLHVWEYYKKRCTKQVSLIWMNWNSDWERSGPSWITSSLQQPLVSGIVIIDSCRSVMHVLYTSLAIFPTRCYQRCYQLDSNLANLEASSRVSVYLTTQLLLVFLLRLLSISRFTRYSVETLFGWGGKHLHDFIATLFGKVCTKFHASYLSFVGDITNKTFWSLFPRQIV